MGDEIGTRRSDEPAKDLQPGADAGSSEATVSPIAATLKILLTSVPHLIGAAVVVRQDSGSAGAVASVGRVPWLYDRRLVSIDLPDDQLPANRPVVLDWPVPHQADWMGAPPRLLVARLVAFDRTVGALLGTLISREQLQPPAREALDLSCQLIASAVATDAVVRASERQSQRLRLLNEIQLKLSSTLEARQLGRILRDAVGAVTEIAAFAVALFHAERDEVAYRYRVADVDALASELSRPALGPNSPAVRDGERFIIYETEVDLPPSPEAIGRTEQRKVTVLQVPMVSRGVPIGVVTLHTFRPDGFSQDELEQVLAIVDAAANYFAHARQLGRFQAPPEARSSEPGEPASTIAAGASAQSGQLARSEPLAVIADAPPLTGVITPAASTPLESMPSPSVPEVPPPFEPATLPTPMPPMPPIPPMDASERYHRSADDIVAGLIGRCVDVGFANAFVLMADVRAGMLRGQITSGSEAMRHIDDATGLSRGTFVVGLDDGSNAIARACREGRVLQVPWAHEVLRPIVQPADALVLERLAGGGRSTIVPVLVEGEVVAALVLGPYADDLSAEQVEAARALVNDAARDLGEARLRASARGEAPASIVPEGLALRLQALRTAL
jgi:hypothetical protein